MASAPLKTHYDNLKVARNATPEIIRAAYKVLAQEYHPDRYPDREKAERIMKILNASYAVLRDADQRRDHDVWIAEQERTASAETMREQARYAERAREAASAAAERAAAADSKQSAESPSRAGRPGPDGSREIHRGEPIREIRRTRMLESVIIILLIPFVAAYKAIKWLLGWLKKLLLVGGAVALGVIALNYWMQKEEGTPLRNWLQQDAGASRAPAPAPSTGGRVTPQEPQVTAEEVGRCTFVYAPVFQVGRDFPHEGLREFGKARLGAVGAILEANRRNAAFKAVIDRDIAKNKQAGIEIEKILVGALRTGDKEHYGWVMRRVAECDRSIGFSVARQTR